MSNNEIPESFNTTELGSLPDGWGVDRLGDNGYFQYGYTTSATAEDTGTKFLRITDIKEDGVVNWGTVPYGIINDESLQKFRLSEGDVLFARIGATTGKTCIIEGTIPNAVFASYLIRFVPNKELHPKYVFYFTQTREYQKLVDAGKEGKLKKGLSATELKNFIIPLPPLPEQHRIAAVLSAVQDAKEKTGAVIAVAKLLKKSLMRHLFTYGPVPAGAAESTVLVETEIGLVPEGWEVVRLGEVAKTYSGGTPKRNKPEYWGGDVHWVKSGELNDKKVFTSVENITEEGLNNSSAKFVEENTLLIAMYGATAGKVGLAKSRFTINQAICAIVPNKNFDSEFYFYYLMNIRDKILAERFGGAQPNLNQQLVKNTKVPSPPPLIQQKIASILSTIDKKIEAEENRKKALDKLFRSLLHNLMTAKIRVNHLEVVQ